MNKQTFLRIAAASVGVGIIAMILPILPYSFTAPLDADHIVLTLGYHIMKLGYLVIAVLLIARSPKALAGHNGMSVPVFAARVIRLAAIWGLLYSIRYVLPGTSWWDLAAGFMRDVSGYLGDEHMHLPYLFLFVGPPTILIFLAWMLIKPPKLLLHLICRRNHDGPLSVATAVRLFAFCGGIWSLMVFAKNSLRLYEPQSWLSLWSSKDSRLALSLSVMLPLAMAVFLLLGAPLLAGWLARSSTPKVGETPIGG